MTKCQASQLVALGLATMAAVSCRDALPTGDSTVPPLVTVATPIERSVTDTTVFTGRTAAVDAVELKARVTGYLLNAPFKEGAEVAKKDVLFEIDPRTYQAQYDAAVGQLEAARAKYGLAKTENARARELFKNDPRAISRKQLDQHQAAEDAAKADVDAITASLEVYKVDLDFTKVRSPIDGRAGRYDVTPGNLVTENVTTLTTVVSQDPIDVYFDVDEQTLLRVLRSIYGGRLPRVNAGTVVVAMGLQDEDGYPHSGKVDFANNTVDPSTGTITVRARFDNPANKEGVRLLLPGLFVRVRMPLDEPRDAILVADRAIGTDQGQKFVYVIDGEGRIEYRRVTLGALQDDGLRVIENGVGKGDSVVLSGIQLVRPKQKPRIRQVAMSAIEAGVQADRVGRDDEAGDSSAAKSTDKP